MKKIFGFVSWTRFKGPIMYPGLPDKPSPTATTTAAVWVRGAVDTQSSVMSQRGTATPGVDSVLLDWDPLCVRPASKCAEGPTDRHVLVGGCKQVCCPLQVFEGINVTIVWHRTFDASGVENFCLFVFFGQRLFWWYRGSTLSLNLSLSLKPRPFRNLAVTGRDAPENPCPTPHPPPYPQPPPYP